MNCPRHYLRFIEMRRGDDDAPWDGRERRAGYRQTATRFARNPLSARNTETVFREMIVHEIKNGALSPWRRKRIVGYAARLGLSATQAGALLAECRDRATAELTASKGPPVLRTRAFRSTEIVRALGIAAAAALGVLTLAATMLLLR